MAWLTGRRKPAFRIALGSLGLCQGSWAPMVDGVGYADDDGGNLGLLVMATDLCGVAIPEGG
jgi:hypothetical protein